jgi:hypothetical protein
VRALWPVGEAAQADYEMLRDAALSGVGLASPVAARFARVGLVGLIVAPAARPAFVAALVGATRPAWTPYEDPRRQALGAAYALLLVPTGVGGQGEAASLTGPRS